MISLIKTSSELDLLRSSGAIVGKVHKELKKEIKIGIKTKLLDKLAEDIIYSSGAVPSFKNYKGYPYSTCISINNTIVHGFPSDYILRDGDVISVDVGALKQGYHGDAAFTVIVGESNNKENKLLVETTESCLNKAIEIAKEGTTTGELGSIIESTANKAGFKVIKNYGGHNIGRDLHEPFFIPNYGKKSDGDRLISGLCICIEPMLVKDNNKTVVANNSWEISTMNGNNAAHVEHQLIIHKDYAEVITI